MHHRHRGLQLHLQEEGQEAERPGGVRAAVPLAAAHHPHLLLLSDLLQLRRRLVRGESEPVLRQVRAAAHHTGLYSGEAPILLAYDQGGLLRHRRGAGGRRPEPGLQRDQNVPAGEAAHHPAQRARRVRTELQRPVHGVRYVRHLPEPQRHHLCHGHPGHAR